SSEAVDDSRNLSERVSAVCRRRLQVTRKLGPQLTDEPVRKIAGQRNRSGFSPHILFTVIADPKIRKRTCRIQKYIVAAVITRRVYPCREMVVLAEREIEFAKACVADHRRGKRSCLF